MKRGYFVYGYDEFWGVAVVATSTKEAKKIAFYSGELIGVEWVDIRCVWRRDVDVANLQIGIIDDLHLALLLGFYCFVEDMACDICGDETLLLAYKNKALCEDCIVKEETKEEGEQEK
jgi:hypothetical protein